MFGIQYAYRIYSVETAPASGGRELHDLGCLANSIAKFTFVSAFRNRKKQMRVQKQKTRFLPRPQVAGRRFLLASSTRCLVLGCMLLSLAACGLSPEYVRPELDLPSAYAEAGEENFHGAENRDWWRSFSSEALSLLQEAALKNNHAFKAERWVLAQALSRARIARADMMPDVSLDGSASKSGRAVSGGYQVTETFSGTVQASYEADIWGKNYEAYNAQTFRAIAGINAWRGAGLTLESETALTYFAHLAARENLAVYDATLENAREVLAYLKKREQYGAAAPLDVARQRSSVESMEADRINYLVAMTETRNSLRRLTGMSKLPDDLIDLIEKESLRDMLPPAIEAGLPSELLFRRPDVAQAEAELQAANADIGVARAAFLPGINLTANAGWQSDSLSGLISPAGALYSLAGSFLQPIFQGGRLMAQYEQTLAAHKELMERYRETALTAFLEVADALDANALLDRQETRRALSSKQAAEAYRIARMRYEAGAEDFLAVLNAQETMLNAESKLVQTRLERLNTVVALFKALGGGWEKMEVEAVD